MKKIKTIIVLISIMMLFTTRAQNSFPPNGLSYIKTNDHYQFQLWRQNVPTGIQFHVGNQNSSIQFMKFGTKHGGLVFDGQSVTLKGMSNGTDDNPDLTSQSVEQLDLNVIGKLTAKTNDHYQFQLWRQNVPTGIQFHVGNQNSSIQFMKFGTKHAGILFDGSTLIFKGMSAGTDDNPDQTTNSNETVNAIFQGKILATGIRVAVPGSANWSDYVFAPEYKLQPLDQVEAFIKENKHLPNVPSAAQMVKEGNDLGATDAKLLEKIEELTLYMIQQNKRIDEMQKGNQEIKKQNEALEKEVIRLKTLIN